MHAAAGSSSSQKGHMGVSLEVGVLPGSIVVELLTWSLALRPLVCHWRGVVSGGESS